MSDAEQIGSPDQRYYLLLASNEMHMSHWVTSAALWERASQRLLLQLGDGLWSSEQIVWSADSRTVTVSLRRYPRDAPGIVLDIYPEQQFVIPRAPLVQPSRQESGCPHRDAGTRVAPDDRSQYG
jgi:hypothetical protein